MDINDAAGAGVSLDDLLKAADAADPFEIRGDAARARAAEAGLVLLDELVDRLTIGDDTEREEAIPDLLDDDCRMRLLGYAHQLHPNRVVARIQRLRGLFRGAAALAKDLQKAIAAVAARQEDAATRQASEHESRARGRLLDALLSELGLKGLRCPSGWEVSKAGLFKDDRQVAPAPIVISEISQDLTTSSVMLTLAWRYRGKWVWHTLEREKVMEARSLIATARYGAPVASGTAVEVVRWLADFEACNLERLPTASTATHLGWQPNGTFLVGATSLGGDVTLAVDEGLAEVASHYHSAGTWDGWCSAIEHHVAPRPAAMLAVYAAACTPLLRLLDAPGFVVDWSGETSRGKTTTLRVGASVWGRPSEDGTVMSWASSSMVGPMVTAHFLQSLPVILDDTKRGKPRVIGSVMYDLPAGQERRMGSAGGSLRKIRRWRTVLLSTGEAPITSFSEAGGSRARCLCVRGSPMGPESAASREAAVAIATELGEHYGHLGPRLVQWLLEHRDQVPELRRRLEEHRVAYADGQSGVGGRLAAYVAMLHLTSELLHDELGVPAPVGNPMALAMEAVTEGALSSDRPTEALRALANWATSNGHRFFTPREFRRPPVQGWAGCANDAFLAFYPHVVDELLERWGYDTAGIVESWYERDWTLRTGRRRHHKMRTPDGTAWMYCFPTDQLVAVGAA